MKQVPESFEYTLLDKNTRTIVWQRASEIKSLMRLTAENIISIGAKLTEVKEQLEHGSFQSWLKTEFEWSEQTARQFMQVYRWSETIKNKNFVFSQLATSALYLLAAPSTPCEARKEVLSLVDEGEKITYTRARSIVNRHKKSVLANNNEVETVDVAAHSEEETSLEKETASDLLFRLETPNFGRVVKLYRAEELEATTELTVGSIVKIKVGRWQGQTARIVEILADNQLLTTDLEAKAPIITPSQSEKITVRPLKEELKKPGISENEQCLTINYGNVCLAVEGNPKMLTAFVERLQTNAAFVAKIFEKT